MSVHSVRSITNISIGEMVGRHFTSAFNH